jgi:hypothetical protein
MCRNIRTLFNFDPPATPDEVRASAEQFVRKLSGFTKPSHLNEAVFETAIMEVSAAAQRLLDSLETTAKPRNREREARKARERAILRFGPRVKVRRRESARARREARRA